VSVPIVNPRTALPAATTNNISHVLEVERSIEDDNNMHFDNIDANLDGYSSGSTVHVSKQQTQRSHETREEKAAQGWADLHNRLLAPCIEASSHPIHGTLCCICSSSDSSVYCQDCGGYFCVSCTHTVHANINIFHTPVLWKVIYLL